MKIILYTCLLISPLFFISSCEEDEIIVGCTDATACNYDELHNQEDGSCLYPSVGYDCNGNIVDYIIGMELYGGILFYLDDTGEHGLIASKEELEKYEWGCYSDTIFGADGLVIGTGLQNSLDIQEECSETPIAAKVALSSNYAGYDDWYLPSADELLAIYNNIGLPYYLLSADKKFWSSSENSDGKAWFVDFEDLSWSNDTATAELYWKNNELSILPIRSF